MTEINLLKRIRPDVPDPDPHTLAVARLRLLNASSVDTRTTPLRGRSTPAAVPRRRLVLAGALAVTLAGGFLVADVAGRDNAVPRGATADAGTFLATAAARSGPDTPIPPGHFRQVTLQSAMTETFTTNPDFQATLFSRSDTWIPAGPAVRYVRQGNKFTKVEFSTPAARAAAQKVAPWLLKPTKPTLSLTQCGETPGGGCQASWVTPTPSFLARQPRDPDALLASLRKDSTALGHPSPPDLRAFLHLSAALNSGLVPADLRAALYRAAAKIPGIRLLDDVTTLDGRHGRAIGLVETDQRHEIVVADRNGEYLGARTVVVGNGHHVPGFHAGDVVDSTSVSMRITASRPAYPAR